MSEQTFIGRATHPSFGDEVADGRIAIDGALLRFVTAEGGVIEIPLGRLDIQPGESGEVFFSDPAQPDWSIYTFDQRVLKHYAFSQSAHTRAQLRELRERKENKWRLKVTMWSVATLIGLVIIGPILLGVVVKILVSRIPDRVEQKMGADALAELKQEMTFLQDSNLMAKLDSAVGPLVAALPPSHSKYTFFIADEVEQNACALPGGYVVVTVGLLTNAAHAEEVAGAVAHEIAHVTQKHILRQRISSMGPMVLLDLFARSDNRLVGALGAVSQLLVIQSFSQEHEIEADAVGWQYLLDARINPHGMIDLLRRFKAEEDREKNMFPEIASLSSHPSTGKRIARLEAKWNKLKNKSGFVEFEGWR